MKKLVVSIFSFACLTWGTVSFAQEEEKETDLSTIIADLKKEYAPDARTQYFKVQVEGEGTPVIKGQTTSREAVEALMDYLQENKISAFVELELLPSSDLKGKNFGVAKLPVCNNYKTPGQNAELTTQMILGTPVQVLQQKDSWLLVRTPDEYLSWVDSTSVQLMDGFEYEKWDKMPKLIFTEDNGISNATPNQHAQKVSDLLKGNILGYLSETKYFYKVQYPNGEVGFVKKDQSMYLRDWLDTRKFDIDEIVSNAKDLLGRPYLWGGTSVKAMDCSGFIKTIYYQNGFILPRDASQQIKIGKEVEIYDEHNRLNMDKTLKVLKKGDLLFFTNTSSKNKISNPKITHVAMYLGDGYFIHSSGKVKINSFVKGTDNFSSRQYNTLVMAKRLDPTELKKLSDMGENFFQNQF